MRNPPDKKKVSNIKGFRAHLRSDHDIYLRAHSKLSAHILRFRSTHEYCKMVKYERLTPSQLRDRAQYLKSRSAELAGRE